MWAAVSPRKRPSPVRGVVSGVRVGDRNYSGGRDPSKRISITLPALCCQSGADVTSEKPTRARRDGVRSIVRRSTWQTPIRFGGRAKRWLVNRSDGIQFCLRADRQFPVCPRRAGRVWQAPRPAEVRFFVSKPDRYVVDSQRYRAFGFAQGSEALPTIAPPQPTRVPWRRSSELWYRTIH
jgi:hypothetical protein